jgi:hypothetical protein
VVVVVVSVAEWNERENRKVREEGKNEERERDTKILVCCALTENCSCGLKKQEKEVLVNRTTQNTTRIIQNQNQMRLFS